MCHAVRRHFRISRRNLKDASPKRCKMWHLEEMPAMAAFQSLLTSVWPFWFTLDCSSSSEEEHFPSTCNRCWTL
uniref:Uncharacterized protein n=1 Tax=Anguilla anguilla TaxID=7936 RepID=A0A0E9SAA6_ANGAN